MRATLHDTRPRGRPGRTGRATAALALFSAFLLLGGCNPFSAPERETARAVVTAEREQEVRIITSRNFALASGGEPASNPDSLETADTLLAVPTFDRTYDISETERFFIRVEPTDTLSHPATLEVFIDGESLGRLQGDLKEEPLQDLYILAVF